MATETKTPAAPAPAPEAKPLSGIEGELVRIESKRRILKKTVQDLKASATPSRPSWTRSRPSQRIPRPCSSERNCGS